MRYTNVHGRHISSLTLGTVQLGMDYGLFNHSNKPTLQQSKEILETALSAGINTFDTSGTYGSAEKIIGDFIESDTAGRNVHVVTKFKISTGASISLENTRNEVYKSIASSLAALSIKRIPICLFHKDKDQPMSRIINKISRIIEDLKKDGLIEIGGLSAYYPADADYVLDNPILEAVQVPFNILDFRLIHSGKLRQLQEQKKIVFARSIFLQGLIFMAPDQLPKNLLTAKSFLQTLHALADEAGLSVPQLAFSFVRDREEITSIIFGAVNAEQVKQNIELLKTKPLTPEIKEKIATSFSQVPELVITPGLWTT